jgi:RNA polymerase sigma-70 factor, ECF subfamily
MNPRQVPDPECQDIFARLSEYLDGELSPEEAAHFEAHIAACPPCVEFVESLKKSIDAAHHFHSPCAPEHVPAEVAERLKKAWAASLARRGPEK